MCPEAFAASSSRAFSVRRCSAAQCSAVRPRPPQTEAPDAAAPRQRLSSRADVAVHDVHGRALRQEKGDDRPGVVVQCCLVQRSGAAEQPRNLEELVEAAPVAAQVAPHRRQVAAKRRLGDVVVSVRMETCRRNQFPKVPE